MKTYFISLLTSIFCVTWISAQTDPTEKTIVEPYVESVTGKKTYFEEVDYTVFGKIVGYRKDGSKKKYKAKEVFLVLSGKKDTFDIQEHSLAVFTRVKNQKENGEVKKKIIKGKNKLNVVYREGNKFFLSYKAIGQTATLSGGTNYTAARYVFLIDIDKDYKKTYLGGKITSDKFLDEVKEMFECEEFHAEIEKVKDKTGKLFKFTKTLEQLTKIYFTSCEQYRN